VNTKYRIRLLICIGVMFGVGFNTTGLKAQQLQYVKEFKNSNHPEIGYWFISPNLYENDLYLKHLDTIASQTKYTMVFLTAREGANFYQYEKMHPIFQKLVAKAHGYGLKVGLQLWGNYSIVNEAVSHRMIIETETTLDDKGESQLDIKAKYIRFPDRLVRSDLFKAYAFKKTGEGFYAPGSLQEITSLCETKAIDKENVRVTIKAGEKLNGLTVCVMTQQYTTQSTAFGKDEANRFIEALHAYADIPFDGFALDEYGNKFVARPQELGLNQPFRGRWYSTDMALQYKKEKGEDLDKILFDGRYAPEGKPEVRIKAINSYMDFMRKGGPMVENAVYDTSRIIFGNHIFNGIHNTYHNSLVNDEIWANGIGWWNIRREYAQSDEKTPTTIQMGMALARKQNIMYNQYYDASLEPVVKKALNDLRYGIRTHYHAMNDKRPLRWDLQFPEAIVKVNKVENCARILNKVNPKLPDMKLLVVFGMEALSNWYPKTEDRGYYDLSNKVMAEERAVEIWNAGYLNALVPSELIEMKKLTLNEKGQAVINGHHYDAVVYLHPQYAKESQLQFLEKFVSKGGKLMIEGEARYNFEGRDVQQRFQSIYSKATIRGYSVEQLSQLGLEKNALPDGCKSEDDVYVYTNYEALMGDGLARFSVRNKGHLYEGTYKGLAAISFDENGNIKKLAGAGFQELKKDGVPVYSVTEPRDLYYERKTNDYQMILADPTSKIKPLINKLF